MPSKTQLITGWVLTGLVGLFLIVASGIPKFIDWPGKKEMFDHLGITAELSPVLGVIEIAVAILFLIPRTSLVGKNKGVRSVIALWNRWTSCQRSLTWSASRSKIRPMGNLSST
jgi:hypothetical protein